MRAAFIQLLALTTVSALVSADDINQLCLKTPFPDVCSSTLQGDPSSKGAPTHQLGLIIVTNVESTVKVAERKVKSGPIGRKSPLEECAREYHIILTANVVASKEAFTLGNYKFAEQYMTDASGAIDRCEFGFPSRKSPVTRENTIGKQLMEVAAAIARTLE